MFFYIRYGIPYRALDEIKSERGVEIGHATLNRWVAKILAASRRLCARQKEADSHLTVDGRDIQQGSRQVDLSVLCCISGWALPSIAQTSVCEKVRSANGRRNRSNLFYRIVPWCKAPLQSRIQLSASAFSLTLVNLFVSGKDLNQCANMHTNLDFPHEAFWPTEVVDRQAFQRQDPTSLWAISPETSQSYAARPSCRTYRSSQRQI